METKQSHQTPLIPVMEPSGVHSLLSFLWNFILLLKNSQQSFTSQQVHFSLKAFPSDWSRDLGLIPLPTEPCGTDMTLIAFEMNGSPVGYREINNSNYYFMYKISFLQQHLPGEGLFPSKNTPNKPKINQNAQIFHLLAFPLFHSTTAVMLLLHT